MNIKTNLNVATLAVDAIKGINVGAYVGTDGLFATDALANYKQQLEGLTVTQQKMALMGTNLTAAQREQVLAYISATAATKTLTAEQVLNCTADEKQLLVKAGLITTEELEKGSTIDLTQEKLKELLANESLSASDKKIILNKFGVTSANLTEASSWGVLAKSIGKAVLEKLKWLALTPEGWIILGVAAVVGAIAAYNKWGATLENTREKLVDLKSECDTITSDIESVNSELKTTKQRLDELEGKDKLTFTEKEEYDNLVKQNNELQRQLDLQKSLLDEKNKEKNKTFVQAMEKDVEQVDEYALRTDGSVSRGYGKSKQDSLAYQGGLTESEAIKQQFKNYQNNLDKIADLDEQYKDDLSNMKYLIKRERIENENNKISEYLQSKNTEFATDSEGVEYIDEPKNEDEEKVNKWLDFINDFQDKMAIAMGGDNAKQNAFNRVVDNWQFDDTVQGLQDLGKEGKVTADMLDDPKYADFIQKLVELKVIDSADDLEGIALAFNNVTSSASSTADTVDSTTAALDALETASDKIGKLASAYKELSDDGYITISTINELKEATGLSGDEWADYEAKLLNAKAGSAEFSQIMSDLTYRIVESNISVGDLTNATEEEIAATEKRIAAVLRENGVTNASTMAHDYLAKKKLEGKYASVELANGVKLDVTALKEEAVTCGVTTNAYLELIAKEILFNRNDLDVSDKVEKLNQIAVAAGLATINMDDLNARFKTVSDKTKYAEENGIKTAEIGQLISSHFLDDEHPNSFTSGSYSFKRYSGQVLYTLPDGTVTKDFNKVYATIESQKKVDEISDAISNITIPQYNSTTSSSSDKNTALDNYLEDAERRYKIHQDETRYIDDLNYALKNLVKTEEERIEVEDEIEEVRKDYATNQIKDIEHLIDLHNNLYGENNSSTLREALDDLGGGGNVNLLLRPQIDTSELNAKGWNAGEGFATVFSSTISNSDFDDLLPSSLDDTVAVNFTPIIVDPNTGEYKGCLTEDELYSYAHDVIAGVRNDDLNLQIGSSFDGANAINEAVSAANEIHLLHELIADGTSLDESVVVSYYNRIQKIAHEEADRLRSIGYGENSDEIQEQQDEWWQAEEKKISLKEATFDKQISSLQHNREMLLNNDPDAYVVDLLKEEQELTHQKAEFYRAVNPEKFADEISELENNWWELQGEIDDLALDYYEKLREEEIAHLELKYDKEQAIISALEKQYEVTRDIRDKRMELESELISSKSLPEYIEDNSTLFNDKDYKKLTDELDRIDRDVVNLYNDYRREINNLSEDEWYKQEEITAQFERQLDIAMDRYELAEKELEIEKKRLEYDNILKQRNTRIMVAGGWRQVADTEKVKEANLAKVQAEKERENLLLTQAENATIRSMQSVSNSTNTLKASVENISTILDGLSDGALKKFARTLDIETVNEYLDGLAYKDYEIFENGNVVSPIFSANLVNATSEANDNETSYLHVDDNGQVVTYKPYTVSQMAEDFPFLAALLEKGADSSRLFNQLVKLSPNLIAGTDSNSPALVSSLQKQVTNDTIQYVFNGDIVLTETIENGDEFVQSLARATSNMFDTTKNMR